MMHRVLLPSLGAGLLILGSCASRSATALGGDPPPPEPAKASPRPPAEAAAPEQPGPREVFPGVRVDFHRRFVEFEGEVPIDAHNPAQPRVELEVLVCIPDSKEHEALVMTRARPSHVHAALLLLGLEPGEPGTWSFEERRLIAHPPRGPAIDVYFVRHDRDGQEREELASDWVRLDGGGSLTEAAKSREGRWVFAGSRFGRLGRGEEVREVYDADYSGLLVGLTTFGGECIAWREVYSHDSNVQAPIWTADPTRTPRDGTRVTVRLRVVDLAP